MKNKMISVQQPYMSSPIENQDCGNVMFFPENRATIPGRMQSELPMSNLPKPNALGSPLSYATNKLPISVGSPTNFSNPEFNGYPSDIYNSAMGSCDIVNSGDMWNSGATFQQQQQQVPYYYHPTSPYNQPYSYDRYGMTDMNSSSHRKNATRESTNTLKAWLQEHKKNPYPTKGEKIMLAIISKMTLTQVSTWFANARRRLKKENKMTWIPKNRSNEAGSEKRDEEEEEENIEDDVFLQTANKDQTSISACGVTPSSLSNTSPILPQKHIWSPLNDSRSPMFNQHNNNMNMSPIQGDHNVMPTSKPTIFSNTFPTLPSSVAASPPAFRVRNNGSFYNEQTSAQVFPNNQQSSQSQVEIFSPASHTTSDFGKFPTPLVNQRVSPYTVPGNSLAHQPNLSATHFQPNTPYQQMEPQQVYSPTHLQHISPNASMPTHSYVSPNDYNIQSPNQSTFPQQQKMATDDFGPRYYNGGSRGSSPQDNSSVVSSQNSTSLSPWNCGQSNEIASTNNRTLSELSVR